MGTRALGGIAGKQSWGIFSWEEQLQSCGRGGPPAGGALGLVQTRGPHPALGVACPGPHPLCEVGGLPGLQREDVCIRLVEVMARQGMRGRVR